MTPPCIYSEIPSLTSDLQFKDTSFLFHASGHRSGFSTLAMQSNFILDNTPIQEDELFWCPAGKVYLG